MIQSAIDQVVARLGLKPADRSLILGFLDDVVTPFPKLPHVSLYPVTAGRGVNWRITYRIKGYLRRTERLGTKQKPAYLRATRVSEILQQVKAGLLKPTEAHRILYVDNSPIEVHVRKFESSLRSTGNVARYVTTTMTRLRRVIELAGFDRLGDISRGALPGLIDKLKAFKDPDTNRTISASTLNDYLAVLRQFTRWATPTLLPADPLVNSGGVKVLDKKDRRDVLVDELAAIVRTARTSAARFQLKGDDRAMLYLLAYGTGLRYRELQSLQIPWLKLDAQPPYIAVPREVQKNLKRDVKQPLPAWLAEELQRWLGERTRGPVWTYLPRDIAPVFERDRADARKAWVEQAPTPEARREREQSDFLARLTSDGEVVFHSQRHAFASGLLAVLDIKTAQLLTRHETTAMLTDRYGHSRMDRAAEGVERAIRNPMDST